MTSTVRQSSKITIQIFDNKKFKKRDQGLPDLTEPVFPATMISSPGFLGLVSMSGTEAISHAMDGSSSSLPNSVLSINSLK
jgi:hypothetical protein